MKGNISQGWCPVCELRGYALHFGYVLFLQMYISYIHSGKSKDLFTKSSLQTVLVIICFCIFSFCLSFAFLYISPLVLKSKLKSGDFSCWFL